MRTIDLKPEHLVQVQAVLREHLLREFPEARVWVFGSRANGRSYWGSDIDLAIEVGGAVGEGSASARLPDAVLDALKEGFHDSDLPQKVDVVDVARLKEDAFKRSLIRDRLPFPLVAAG